MGTLIDFQHVLNGSTELIISIIVISVAAYYLLLKSKTSSQPHEYTSRSITKSILYQQHSLAINKYKGPSASKRDIIQQQSTDSQSLFRAAIGGDQGNSIRVLHSGVSSDTTSIGVAEQTVLISQFIKESPMGNDRARLPDQKSTSVKEEAVVPDTLGISPLATHRREWSEAEKIDKLTADLDISTLKNRITTTSTTTTTDFVDSPETIVQDLGSNQNVEISQPIITALKDTAHLATTASTTSGSDYMENQLQRSMDDTNINGGEENERCGNNNIVDKEQANDIGEDCAAQVEVHIPVKPSTHQNNIDDGMLGTTEYMSHVESSNPPPTDDIVETKDAFERSAMMAYGNGKNDESATPLDHKETSSNDTTSVTNKISVKKPTSPSLSSISPKKKQQHAISDISSDGHTKATLVPLRQPVADSKSKQDMSRLERIDQQRQPYIALYKSRCEFWPGCTNNHCKYYHPFMECRNGKACKFGKKCVFLHPKDYLDYPHQKQTDQAMKKNKGKNKIKIPGNKLHRNQATPSKKTVE